MSAPPSRASLFPVGSLSPAAAKTAMAAFFDFAMQRLAPGTAGVGTATAAELQATRDSLGVGVGSNRNAFTNGGCMVAQRLPLGTIAITSSPVVGQVDNIAAWMSTGTPTAGSLIQAITSSIGTTGYAFEVSQLTVGAGGVLAIRIRIEAREAVKRKNKTGVFAVQVWHDAGVALNYTVIVRKANAADNFTATTAVYSGSPVSVASGTPTTISMPATALGDVSNGIEVVLSIACGAVTLKTFRATEWQFEDGTIPTPFEHRPYADELRACQRYLPWRTVSTGGPIGTGVFFSSTAFQLFVPFLVQPRISPTSAATSTGNAFTVVTAGAANIGTAIAFTGSSMEGAEFGITVSGGTGNAGLVRATGAIWIAFGGCEIAV